MSTPSANDIKDVAFYWINNLKRFEQDNQGRMVVVREGTAEKIMRAYKQRGDWEGWAQVELATLIEQKYEKDFHIRRGDSVYNDSKKKACILLIGRNDPKKRLVIELKVQSAGRDASAGPASVVKEVQQDLVKFQKDLRADVRPARCVALGISCTVDAGIEVAKESSGVTRQKCWGPVPSADGKRISGPIFVFWRELNLS